MKALSRVTVRRKKYGKAQQQGGRVRIIKDGETQNGRRKYMPEMSNMSLEEKQRAASAFKRMAERRVKITGTYRR